MTLVTYSIMPSSVFFVGKAGPVTVPEEHPNFHYIINALLDDEDPTNLVDAAAQINKAFAHGGVRVEDGVLTLHGKPIEDGELADYVVRLVEAGETDPAPFVRFVESLDCNPSRNSRAQLFSFIRANGLTLHEDGRILAYKGVNDDYTDKHTGTIDNSAGAKPPRMSRRDIDDNPANHCSYGYHVGAWAYASNFGERTMLTATKAADVVSVPNDHNAQKMRVCEYEVISEVEDGEPVGVPVYRSPWEGYTTDQEDDDYETEPKRYLVVLKALGSGLSGYDYKTFDMIEEESEEDAIDAAHSLWGRLDAETVSVTEL